MPHIRKLSILGYRDIEDLEAAGCITTVRLHRTAVSSLGEKCPTHFAVLGLTTNQFREKDRITGDVTHQTIFQHIFTRTTLKLENSILE